MKVIYKKSVLEQIENAVQEARMFRKSIDKITLTPNEFDSLLNEIHNNTAILSLKVNSGKRSLPVFGFYVEEE